MTTTRYEIYSRVIGRRKWGAVEIGIKSRRACLKALKAWQSRWPRMRFKAFMVKTRRREVK